MSEVATFVQPVDQFEGGESAYECVAFSCALVKYATAPGTHNPYTPEQVDQLADTWYTKETGSIHSVDGLNVPQEQAILAGLGLTFSTLPVNPNTPHDSDMAYVTAALKKRYPVLICGTEAGFVTAQGDQIPYTWPPSGNHCIVASGIAPSGNFLVRDMAALANGWQPGVCREYDNRHMDLISATAVLPSWVNQGGQPPDMRKAFEIEWSSQAAVDLNSGISSMAWSDYQAGHFHGPALNSRLSEKQNGEYQDVDQYGNPVRAVDTPNGAYHWRLDLNRGTFYPYH